MLISELDVAVDPATASIPMVLPEAVANTEWAQFGGNASKSVGHVALGNALAHAFSVSIGYGTSLTERLASPPVIGGGQSIRSMPMPRCGRSMRKPAARRGRASSAWEKGNSTSLYGGGVLMTNRIYASNGLGYVAAWTFATVACLAGAPGRLCAAPRPSSATRFMSSARTIRSTRQDLRRIDQLVERRGAEIAGVFGTAFRLSGRDRGCRLLIGRTQRLPL